MTENIYMELTNAKILFTAVLITWLPEKALLTVAEINSP